MAAFEDLERQLDLIDVQSRLAREDLQRGDYRRVAAAISTMNYVTRDADMLLREGIDDAASLALTAGRKMGGGGGRPVTSPIGNAILEVLRESGKPMHLREITEALESRGDKPPGEGKAANLISYLRRLEDVVRVQRGVYALRDWDIPVVK